MIAKRVSVALSIFLSVSSPANPTQWSTDDGGNGHWYQAIAQPSAITWSEAQANALQAGGYLASITSEEENAFVFQLVDDFDAYWFTSSLNASLGPWIGGRQSGGSMEPAGGWSWVSGEDFLYQKWASGEPNNSSSSGPNEDSTHFFFQGTDTVADTWNDLDGDGQFALRSYVIEFEELPNDVDNDGVSNDLDNCLFVSNPTQRDTDNDALGNICDADLNNDCIVNAMDLGLFRAVFFTNDPDSDFNGDGVVNAVDLGQLKLQFFTTPGPSGSPNLCQ